MEQSGLSRLDHRWGAAEARGRAAEMALVFLTFIPNSRNSFNRANTATSWTDRDIIIMNPNIPLSIFLTPPDLNSTHLMIAEDFNGINIGIFLIRVSKFRLRFMMETSVYRSFFPNETLKWAEQSAMAELLKAHPDYLLDGTVRIVPQHWFNAYPGPRNESTGLLPEGDWHNRMAEFTEGIC